MPAHAKHDDSINVQIRTKFLDAEGHEMLNVIEYDPVTGYGKRVKDGSKGLIEPFYAKDGSIEIDGHTFDSDNHTSNLDKIDALRTLIDMNANPSDKHYQNLLEHHTNIHKNTRLDKHAKPQVVEERIADAARNKTMMFRVIEDMKAGQTVEINPNTGEIKLSVEARKAMEEQDNNAKSEEPQQEEEINEETSNE